MAGAAGNLGRAGSGTISVLEEALLGFAQTFGWELKTVDDVNAVQSKAGEQTNE